MSISKTCPFTKEWCEIEHNMCWPLSNSDLRRICPKCKNNPNKDKPQKKSSSFKSLLKKINKIKPILFIILCIVLMVICSIILISISQVAHYY